MNGGQILLKRAVSKFPIEVDWPTWRKCQNADFEIKFGPKWKISLGNLCPHIAAASHKRRNWDEMSKSFLDLVHKIIFTWIYQCWSGSDVWNIFPPNSFSSATFIFFFCSFRVFQIMILFKCFKFAPKGEEIFWLPKSKYKEIKWLSRTK